MSKLGMRSRRDFKALEVRRLKAARLFEQGATQSEVAYHGGVSRPTALRWHRAWQRKGRDGLKAAGRAGRKPRLSQEAARRVEQALLQGPLHWGFRTNLWTLERVAAVIGRCAGVRYSVPQTWRVLRRLGWSRQRPARRAKEANPSAIRRWIRQDWPRIKKTPDV